MKHLIVILLMLPLAAFSQLRPEEERAIDSLKQVIETAPHDTVKVLALMDWEEIIYVIDPDKDIELNERVISICKENLAGDLNDQEEGVFKNCLAAAYGNLGITIRHMGRFRESIDLQEKALKIRTELNDLDGIAKAHNNMGNVYLHIASYDTAEFHFEKSLAIREEMGDRAGQAASLGNLGVIAQRKGDYVTGIKLNMECLKLQEEQNDLRGMALSYNNIGGVYFQKGDLEEAMEFYQKGLETSREYRNEMFIAGSLLNIGQVSSEMKDFETAESNLREAMSIQIRIGDIRSLASAYNSMGSMWKDRGNIDSAYSYYIKAEELVREIGNFNGLPSILMNIARIDYSRGRVEEAIQAFEEAKRLGFEKEYPENIRESASELHQIYAERGEMDKAYANHVLFIEMRDSLNNLRTTDELNKQRYKYEYEKQAIEDSTKNAEREKLNKEKLARRDAELAAKRNEQVMLYGGLGLVIVFSLFVLNRFRVTRRQKTKIEEQRDMVEEKNKEILDSINYAKRLQDAILPAPKVVKEYLGESFILYKPKDIVAGDFYWLETPSKSIDFDPPKGGLNQDDRPPLGGPSQRDEGEWTYIAAADCTGHGVPGAMVSVVCSNALSKALVEEGITDTGKLLDRTRQLVIERFGKSDSEIKDGMDISLAAIRHDGKQVRWSGANNPLWVVKNPHSELRTTNYELLHEVKPDKQPIGKYAKETPFTQHTIDIEPGDSLYMFSDGYIDQFGGEKGKKYKSGRLKKLLLSIQDKSMADQKIILNKEFEDWRKDVEQIDDVCVVGIRL